MCMHSYNCGLSVILSVHTVLFLYIGREKHLCVCVCVCVCGGGGGGGGGGGVLIISVATNCFTMQSLCGYKRVATNQVCWLPTQYACRHLNGLHTSLTIVSLGIPFCGVCYDLVRGGPT